MAIKNIKPDHDSFAQESDPTTPKGSLSLIRLKQWDVTRSYPYLKWSSDLISRIPSRSVINSATINLYVWECNTASGYETIPTYQINADWDESTMTWNNKPAVTGSSLGNMDFTSIGWKTLDITSLFTDWFNGTKNAYGIRIGAISTTMISSSPLISIYSTEEEAETDKHPYISVDYTSGGFQLWWGFCESWQRRNKLWRNNKLVLPKDLGFSY